MTGRVRDDVTRFGRWKCRHGWHPFGNSYPYSCRRCDQVPKACSNCGRPHNPNVITICTVTRSPW